MIPPHGGTLVQQYLSLKEEASFGGLPCIPMSFIATSDLLNIASGVFSPLTGFMDSETVAMVVEENRIGQLAWTIPITLDVPRELAESIRPGQVMGLQDPHGVLRGTIEVSDVFPHEKDWRCNGTFGTSEPGHPGVLTVQRMEDWLVGGTVSAFQPRCSPPDRVVTPQVSRERFAEMGWETVAGFQTRNPPHRAHEYLQRCALELTDGLFVQPLTGWVKPGDFLPNLVIKTYEFFINEIYPPKRVFLGSLNTAMRYAGPKEAVFHAIVRQNFGCTHFIVGRDHAGVRDDEGIRDFYGKYEAHRFFNEIPDLDIQILKFYEPFFCTRCGFVATDKTCGHPDERRYISGSIVRDALVRGDLLTSDIMREEVFRFLLEQQCEGELFHTEDTSIAAV